MSDDGVGASRPDEVRQVAPLWTESLKIVVAGLHRSREVTHNIRRGGRIRHLPSQQVLTDILVRLSSALFPTHYGQTALTAESIDGYVEGSLREALALLEEQARRDLLSSPQWDHLTTADIDRKAGEIVDGFSRQLPKLRTLLVSDLQAAYAGDPAARSYPEIMLTYPGLIAVRCYRLGHALHLLGGHLLARLISKIAHAETAIDIHPGAVIGHSLFISHGTGVVIGETAILGDRVRIEQAVTLGPAGTEAGTDKRGKGRPRDPIVGSDVVIHAGATVLGRITIGEGSVIGSNVSLTRSVPDGSIITQASLRSSAPAPVEPG